MPGRLVSRYSLTMTPRSTANPACSASAVRGRTPMPDNDEIGFEPFPALQCDTVPIECGGRRAEVEDDAMLLVHPAYEVPDFGPKHSFHRPRLRRDDAHLEPACPQRCRDLETDEAGTDHDGPARLCRLRNQGPTVRQSAQIVDLRQIAAGKGEPERLGARGQQQRAVMMPTSICKLDLPGIGVDRYRPGPEPQLDPVPPLELEANERYPFPG